MCMQWNSNAEASSSSNRIDAHSRLFTSRFRELVCKISILQRSNLILANVPTKSNTHERPMISLRMGLTSGIATSNGSSKPMEIKLQVMHRKGFSLLG